MSDKQLCNYLIISTQCQVCQVCEVICTFVQEIAVYQRTNEQVTYL